MLTKTSPHSRLVEVPMPQCALNFLAQETTVWNFPNGWSVICSHHGVECSAFNVIPSITLHGGSLSAILAHWKAAGDSAVMCCDHIADADLAGRLAAVATWGREPTLGEAGADKADELFAAIRAEVKKRKAKTNGR